MTHAQKADHLLKLHHGKVPLVLVNAWDAASAAVVAHCGFPAIATSSAAVANALGYADGQHIPWAEMAVAIRRIAEAVALPVTADIEAGFSPTLQDLEWNIEQMIEAGAVGINLEDAVPGHKNGPLYPLPEQTKRIQKVRGLAERLKIHLVINARTDAYWQAGVSAEAALASTVERGRAYLQAGADCVFVPGLKDAKHIGEVVAALQAPVNVLAVAGTPSVPELAALGVKRVSTGSGSMRAAMGALRRLAEEVRTSGTYKSLLEDAVPYAEMNGFFVR
ncbi:MAG TPA: isocitrate lyase/phosphoenolpyruvate mutase family protein [Candidatus Angelobacter sp.]|nr:isocitrate lyase/phosphoenolpyruvate mutase family protein [Candidatus Angelobacter sp.]